MQPRPAGKISQGVVKYAHETIAFKSHPPKSAMAMRTNYVVVAADNGDLPLWQWDITVKQASALRCHIKALGKTSSHINEIRSGLSTEEIAINALSLHPIPSI